jgi:hypothetical protein
MIITEDGLVAARWQAYPDGLLDLAPDPSGRSCVATGKAPGRTTVKATGVDGQAVGHFSVVVKAASPAPAATTPATTPSTPATATEAAHAAP